MSKHVVGASPVLLLEWWKPVVGWEGWYEVSVTGRLRRVKPGHHTKPGKILVDCHSSNGYVRNVLHWGSETKKQSLSRHRLVALAFLGNPGEGMQVNHRNGCKSDNRLSNLEWVTPRQNTQHSYSTGLQKRALTDSTIRDIRLRVAEGCKKKAVADQFKVDPSTVSRIVSGHIYALVR